MHIHHICHTNLLVDLRCSSILFCHVVRYGSEFLALGKWIVLHRHFVIGSRWRTWSCAIHVKCRYVTKNCISEGLSNFWLLLHFAYGRYRFKKKVNFTNVLVLKRKRSVETWLRTSSPRILALCVLAMERIVLRSCFETCCFVPTRSQSLRRK